MKASMATSLGQGEEKQLLETTLMNVSTSDNGVGRNLQLLLIINMVFFLFLFLFFFLVVCFVCFLTF